MDNVLEVKGLCKKYGDFELKKLTFDIGTGEIVGFIGENGAGKTTAIKSILRINLPDEGEIKVFGMDIAENEKKLKMA